jgi:SAM-dependent methyltransferase
LSADARLGSSGVQRGVGAACEICGATGGHRIHHVREMMFGLGGQFRYLECGNCGCVALLDVPSDLARYYPPDYYSFRGSEAVGGGTMVRALKRLRAEAALRSPAGLVDRLADRGVLPGLFRWTAGLGLRTTSRIADIGSGNGQILTFFANNGFTNLAGFDPYLTEDRVLGAGIRLRRAALSEVPGSFDLVMVHHAFEHMPDPKGTLKALAALANPAGALVIRTPVADSWAWRHYGVNWVQLDPPRHLYVHTTRSMQQLAGACGLRVYRCFRDSRGFQFWGSELYARDLPLREYDTRLSEVFGAEALDGFERRAGELNAAGTGDSACFVLRRR